MNSKVAYDAIYQSDEMFDAVTKSGLQQSARRALAGGWERGRILEVVYQAIEPEKSEPAIME